MKNFIAQVKSITSLTDHIDINRAQNYIVSSIRFSGANVWILIFAIVIASVGLNVNSIPVVIGAMLISPIMGPIMGVGLALGINDTGLLKKSFKNLIVMTLVSIFVSTLFFVVTPLDLETPTELLARTNPTIYDVFIALFGGFAVIVEVCKKEKGTVIAGAAIATALMPPLCTAGYGIASGSIAYFAGAFYLYFINSVFIALATFLTVRYLHFPFVKFTDSVKQKKVNRSITIFTIILIIPSIYSAISVIRENSFNLNAKKFVNENTNMESSYIYDYKISHAAGQHSTLTIAIAGEPLSDKDINILRDKLSEFNINEDQLVVNQNSTFSPSNGVDNNELVNSLLDRSDVKEQRMREQIVGMERVINTYKSRELPGEQIAKEVKAQFPQLVTFTITRGETISFEKVVAVQDSTNANSANQNSDSKQASDLEKVSIPDKIIASITVSDSISTQQLKSLKDWLGVRLNNSNVSIIIDSE